MPVAFSGATFSGKVPHPLTMPPLSGVCRRGVPNTPCSDCTAVYGGWCTAVGAAHRFLLYREAPLADEGGARWSVWNFVRGCALDGKTVKLLRGYVSTHHDVADNAHAQTIDFRDLAGQRLCLRGSPDPDHG